MMSLLLGDKCCYICEVCEVFNKRNCVFRSVVKYKGFIWIGSLATYGFYKLLGVFFACVKLALSFLGNSFKLYL